LAASLSARRNSQGIARIGNARKPNNLRDNIFAVTQKPEIVGLLCSYKTNNLHIFRTETFYHLNPKLPLTSKAANRKSINILTPSMPSIDFCDLIIARDMPELEISHCGFRILEGMGHRVRSQKSEFRIQ
jgi:hypothetical protein